MSEGKMMTIYDIVKYDDNGSIVTVGLINEEPSCLYLERLTLKKTTDNICEVYPKCKEENTESRNSCRCNVGMFSEIRDNRIISVYNTTDYSDMPLKDKYLNIIRDNSKTSIMFNIFKKYMGNIIPKDRFAIDWVKEEGIDFYGGSYSSPFRD